MQIILVFPQAESAFRTNTFHNYKTISSKLHLAFSGLLAIIHAALQPKAKGVEPGDQWESLTTQIMVRLAEINERFLH